MKETIKFELNGSQVDLETDSDQVLLWVLRTELGLTGAKFGCGIGFCGACTILVDGVAERSCTMTVKEIAGRKVTTIEGLAKGEVLHPVQEAFLEHDAQQCGYCTSGMIMNAVGLLENNPNPDRQEIIDNMEGNLCRCGSYGRIIDAIETASKQINGGNQ